MSAQTDAAGGARPSVRHFLDLDRFDEKTLRDILERGVQFRRAKEANNVKTLRQRPLEGRVLALIFSRPSTRTRVSFEVGMRQLGGDVVVLDSGSSQIGRGETIADTARVLSRYVDAIMIRTGDPAAVESLAAHAAVPVINGLTDRSHPCQVMADIMTFEQHRGPVAGASVAWVGDGNNVANSWIQAAALFGFALRLGCPNGHFPDPEAIGWARDRGAQIDMTEDPRDAVNGADAVVTDTWVSMGMTDAEARIAALSAYQVNEALMALAAKDALFMHCLPAHRGEEVTDSVIDGPHSVVWDEAENRLHVQKAILTWCLT